MDRASRPAGTLLRPRHTRCVPGGPRRDWSAGMLLRESIEAVRVSIPQGLRQDSRLRTVEPGLSLQLRPGNNSAAFFDRENLAGLLACKPIDATAGPHHFDTSHLRLPPKPERERQLTLRQVARTGLDHLATHPAVRPSHGDMRADRISVRLCAAQHDTDRSIGTPAIVAQQLRRTIIGGDEKVGITV